MIFKEGPSLGDEKRHAEGHDQFISSLIRRNLVLLGGAFSDNLDGAWAAYVLRSNSLAEARAIAEEDPFVINDVMRPVCVEWQLVGINPEAIDPQAVVRPDDV